MRKALAAAFAFLAAACTPAAEQEQNNQVAEAAPERMVAPVLTGPDAKDIHSYARPAEARVTHVALDLEADFENKRLEGTALLDIQAAEGAKEIVLDTKNLDIRTVTDAAGKPLDYTLGEADPNLGAPLIVPLNGTEQIRIGYRTAPDAAALQWLAPEQTAGKKLPYLFSQGQAILNRTWIPTQDSPGIRQTWEARIVVPEPLKAVMSAENLTPAGESVRGGKRAFRFRMDKPVAPYLIALAVGDLAFQPLGPRTGVYTEPSMLKAAAAELADTEKMIDAAEKLYGPYRWGRYDMIVLPPSFPFGGMENPRLTFLTPTMIAGDRSLVSLIAHELAHSWSGNLVTNANWSDFWLNEGFTTYIESRIMEQLYGPRAAAMNQAQGWEDVHAEIGEMGGMEAPGSQLYIDLAGKDPDEGMTGIPYEKGAAFLRTIEQAVGRTRFDAYLRSYFDRYAFQPMTTQRFIEDLRANLIQGDEELAEKLRIEEWIYEPGMPDNAVPPKSQEFVRVQEGAKGYAEGNRKLDTLNFGKWSTQERVRFLNALPRQLPRERLAALDEEFGLSKSGNSEVLFAWLKLALANRYEPAVPAAERFLTSMGRRKFVEPLFKVLLSQGDWGRPIAERIWEKAGPTYHAVTANSVEALINPPEEAEGEKAKGS